MVDHEALVESLSRSIRPVDRPLPPVVRAVGWMVLALPAGLLATGFIQKTGFDWADAGAMWAALAIGLSFLLGMSAIVAAFAMSIAGRAVRLGIWFGIGIALWLAANIAGIATTPHPLGRIGSGSYCFKFMMLASAPMICLAIAWLRRTRAIHPDQTLTMAGLGIAFTSLTLLGFCHPASGRLLDFTGHVAAAVSVVGLTVLCGRRWVAI
jgi:hypothetical protein